MFIDLTIAVEEQMRQIAAGNEDKVLFGHLGTHFDVMDKEFPLEYLERNGIAFDVSGVEGREIAKEDILADKIEEGMFIAFYTGFIEREGYGTKEYFTRHPELSVELLEFLLEKKAAVIGVDFAGVRRGTEHTKMDQYCADRGAFVVENLCNLDELLKGRQWAGFQANTYPIKFKGMTGLPCRVAAKI